MNEPRLVGHMPIKTITQQMASVGLTIISIAELTELRALKAKVDGCRVPTDHWVVTNEHGHRLLYADDLLAWLREP